MRIDSLPWGIGRVQRWNLQEFDFELTFAQQIHLLHGSLALVEYPEQVFIGLSWNRGADFSGEFAVSVMAGSAGNTPLFTGFASDFAQLKSTVYSAVLQAEAESRRRSAESLLWPAETYS